MAEGSGRGRAAGPDLGDLAFAAVIIAVSVIVWVGTADLPPPRYEPVGSAALPRGISLIMAALAVVVALRALRAGPSRAEEPATRRAVARAIALAGLLAVFVGLMDARIIGFRPAAAGFLFLAVLILSGLSWRSLAASAAFAAILSLGLHAVFTRLFYIDLP